MGILYEWFAEIYKKEKEYSMKPYIFGVDIGGTTVKMGLFQSDGTKIEQWEIPTRTENKSERLLPDIAEAIFNKRKKYEIKVTEVEGIGVGVPGAVLKDAYVKPCVNLNQWGGFDVAGKLSKMCQIPVKIVNDANAAALGEMSHGGGKGHKNVVFVTLGTGVGGGIIINGRLVSGVHGSGGEIGHIKMNPNEQESCGCGKKGCLEQYASATGIVRMAKKALEESEEESILSSCEHLSAKKVFDCAKEGDKLSEFVVNEMADILGRALASVSCVCDPEVIVIGGGVAKAGEYLLKKIQKYFERYAFPAAEETQFALAELGNDAGIYGGMQIITEK